MSGFVNDHERKRQVTCTLGEEMKALAAQVQKTRRDAVLAKFRPVLREAVLAGQSSCEIRCTAEERAVLEAEGITLKPWVDSRNGDHTASW
jgi:hypothetical protein